MNKELISKLRKQSKVDPKEIVRALADTNDSAVVEHWLEQFAEQIVRECANVALWEQGKGYDVGEIILKHFGVEQ